MNNSELVKLSSEPVIFNDPAAIKKIGLIALATDLTSERDFARLLPKDKAAVYVNRVAYQNPTTPENLRRMAPRLTSAADLILPEVSLDAICYSCTAASVVIGDEAIRDSIHTSRPGVPVITPSDAACRALRALGATRISILTPYTVETSQPFAEYFSAQGLNVLRLECLGIEDDRDMALVSDDTIIQASVTLNTDDTDALFISCTGLPAVNVVEEIERQIGKPVVSSNQASIWMSLRAAGLDDSVAGFGSLFDKALPDPVISKLKN